MRERLSLARVRGTGRLARIAEIVCAQKETGRETGRYEQLRGADVRVQSGQNLFRNAMTRRTPRKFRDKICGDWSNLQKFLSIPS